MDENENQDDTNQNLSASSGQVVSYKANQVILMAPEVANGRFIAYTRPNDVVMLNFDLKQLKVDVVRGDVHIVFPNGSTLTLASMGALGFSVDAPKLVSVAEGAELTLDEFLSKTEVLDYDKAVLILTNKDEHILTETQPDVVKVASEQESTLEAGTPISGVGETDIATKGVASPFIDPSALVITNNTLSGQGQFVVTIYTSNYPFLLDRDNLLPGQITLEATPNLAATIWYGAHLPNIGNVTMNGQTFQTYRFQGGLGDTNEAIAQLDSLIVNQEGSVANIFINNNADKMKYVAKITYGKGIFPSKIDVVVPYTVKDFLKLEMTSFGGFDKEYTDADNNYVYNISHPDAGGEMDFNILFPQDQSQIPFDLTYVVYFFNPTTGEPETIDVTQGFMVYPLLDASELGATGNRLLISSAPPPVDVKTGSGDDIVTTGAGYNIVNTNDGADKVFSSVGHDLVNLGNGDDQYWGSSGVDVVDGGAGYDKVYFNNQRVAIDNTGNDFKDNYFETYKDLVELTSNFGFTRNEIIAMLPTTINARLMQTILGALTDNSVFIKLKRLTDLSIFNNMEEFHLSKNNDTVNLSDKNTTTYIIHSGGRSPTGRDTLVISDKFDNGSGAVIDLRGSATKAEIKTLSGVTKYITYDFNYITASSGNDILYGGLGDTTNGTIAYILDGGAGVDTLDYSSLDSSQNISFDAGNGRLGISNTTGFLQTHNTSNFERIIGTANVDTFYGSFSNNYHYNSGSNPTNTSDKLSYEKGNLGVTWILGGIGGVNTIYKISNQYDKTLIPTDTAKDTYEGNMAITLSKGDDVIIGGVPDGYIIGLPLSGGLDTLSYIGVNENLTFKMQDPTGTNNLTKGFVIGADVDTFYYDNVGGVRRLVGGNGINSFDMKKSFVGSVVEIIGTGTNNTLSYFNSGYTAADTGVSFNFGVGVGLDYVQKTGGGIDYFKDINKYIGTKGNDTIILGSQITKITQIQGLNIDTGEGVDVLNLVSLPDTLTDLPGVTTLSVQALFASNGNMTIKFGQYDPTVDPKNLPSNSPVATFIHMEGIIGTKNTDIITAIDNLVLSFDGAGGIDIADYSDVNTDIIFNMSLREKNVTKGSGTGALKDTLKNVEVIYGGSVNNTFFSNSYSNMEFIGNSMATNNLLSYDKLASSIAVDFTNSTVSKDFNNREDKFSNIGKIQGTFLGDTFYAHEAPSLSNETIDGGNGVDILDFSKFVNSSNALNLDFKSDVSQTLTVANVNWNITNINGIRGTKWDDTITLYYDKNYTISGNEGYDKVLYNANNITLTSGFTVSADSIITINKFLVTNTYRDAISEVEELTLTSQNDVLNIFNNYAASGLKKIDAGSQVTNPDSIEGDKVSFANYNIGDLVINIDNNSGVTVFTPTNLPSALELENFEIIEGNRGNTTYKILTTTLGAVSLEGVVRGISDTKITTIDFSSISATGGLTITFNETLQKDKLEGVVDAPEIFFRNINKYILTGGDDTVNLSSNKDGALYIGGAGNDTLDYHNDNVTSAITIDYSASKIYKDISLSVFDSYQEIEAIKGSKYGDTLKITNLTTPIALDIDLGDGDDTVELSITTAALYDLDTSRISTGTTFLDLSRVSNAEIIKLTSLVDTTQVGDNFQNTAFKEIDGGNGADIIDATGKTSSGLAFYAGGSVYKAQIAHKTGPSEDFLTYFPTPTPSSVVTFKNFEIVRGSNTQANIFFGDYTSSYNFVGGNGVDILSYSQATAGVTIDLGAKIVSKRVDANGNTAKDTYTSIEKIIGSKYIDTFIFDDSLLGDPTIISNLNLWGDPTPSPSALKDKVNFNFTQKIQLTIQAPSSGSGPNDISFLVGTSPQSYTTQFNNINNIILSRAGNNVFTMIGEIADSLTISSPGAGNNTAVYNVSSLEFDVQRGVVERGAFKDFLTNFQTIDYAGSGTALFKASETFNYSFTATGTPTSATVSYINNIAGPIKVTFIKNGVDNIANIQKGSNPADKDNILKGITKIIGTTFSDEFILDTLSPGTSITIDGAGGSGVDVVSFINLYPNGHTFDTALFSNIAGYTIIGMEAYNLTNGNDTFKGSIGDASFTINALGGIDTLDYSAYTGYDVTIDFVTGRVTKQTTSASQPAGASDIISGFEKGITGDGDDVFILGDNQLGYVMDAGTGRNILDFLGVTKSSIATYLGSDLKATFLGISEIQYDNFDYIRFSLAKTELTYTYSDANKLKNLRFEASSAARDNNILTLNIPTTSSLRFEIDLTDILTGRLRAIEPSIPAYEFMEFTNFKTIKAASTSDSVLSIIASNNPNMSYNFVGGRLFTDQINYTGIITSVTLSITSVTADEVVNATLTKTGSTDTLQSIEKFYLGDGDNTLKIVERASATNDIIIDGGRGVNTISLASFINAVTLRLDQGSASFIGYDFTNFSNYSLTPLDDTVHMPLASPEITVDGGGSSTLGDSIYYGDSTGTSFARIKLNMHNADNNIILATKSVGGQNVQDTIIGFKNITLPMAPNDRTTIGEFNYTADDGVSQSYNINLNTRIDAGTTNSSVGNVYFSRYRDSSGNGLIAKISSNSIGESLLEVNIGGINRHDNLNFKKFGYVKGTPYDDIFNLVIKATDKNYNLGSIDGAGGSNQVVIDSEINLIYTLAPGRVFDFSVLGDHTHRNIQKVKNASSSQKIDYLVSAFSGRTPTDAFTIDGGVAFLDTVSYSQVDANPSGIIVDINVANSASVTKSTGKIDTLNNINKITGTQFDDIYKFNTLAVLQAAMIVDGNNFSSIGNTMDLSGIPDVANHQITLYGQEIGLNPTIRRYKNMHILKLGQGISNIELERRIGDNFATKVFGVGVDTSVNYTADIRDIARGETIIVDLVNNVITVPFTSSRSHVVSIEDANIGRINIEGGGLTFTDKQVTVLINEDTANFGEVELPKAPGNIVDLRSYNTGVFASSIIGSYGEAIGYQTILIFNDSNFTNQKGVVINTKSILFSNYGNTLHAGLNYTRDDPSRGFDLGGSINDNTVVFAPEPNKPSSQAKGLTLSVDRVRFVPRSGVEWDLTSSVVYYKNVQVFDIQKREPNDTLPWSVLILDNYAQNIKSIKAFSQVGVYHDLYFKKVSGNTIGGNFTYPVTLNLSSNSSIQFLGKSIDIGGFTNYTLSSATNIINIDSSIIYNNNIVSTVRASAGGSNTLNYDITSNNLNPSPNANGATIYVGRQLGTHYNNNVVAGVRLSDIDDTGGNLSKNSFFNNVNNINITMQSNVTDVLTIVVKNHVDAESYNITIPNDKRTVFKYQHYISSIDELLLTDDVFSIRGIYDASNAGNSSAADNYVITGGIKEVYLQDGLTPDNTPRSDLTLYIRDFTLRPSSVLGADGYVVKGPAFVVDSHGGTVNNNVVNFGSFISLTSFIVGANSVGEQAFIYRDSGTGGATITLTNFNQLYGTFKSDTFNYDTTGLLVDKSYNTTIYGNGGNNIVSFSSSTNDADWTLTSYKNTVLRTYKNIRTFTDTFYDIIQFNFNSGITLIITTPPAPDYPPAVNVTLSSAKDFIKIYGSDRRTVDARSGGDDEIYLFGDAENYTANYRPAVQRVQIYEEGNTDIIEIRGVDLSNIKNGTGRRLIDNVPVPSPPVPTPTPYTVLSSEALGLTAHTHAPYEQKGTEVDTIKIKQLEENKIIDTGLGKDDIYLLGDAADYTVEQIDTLREYFNLGGKDTFFSGSYLIIRDAAGKEMYLLNSTLDDILSGTGLRYINGVEQQQGITRTDLSWDSSTHLDKEASLDKEDISPETEIIQSTEETPETLEITPEVNLETLESLDTSYINIFNEYTEQVTLKDEPELNFSNYNILGEQDTTPASQARAISDTSILDEIFFQSAETVDFVLENINLPNTTFTENFDMNNIADEVFIIEKEDIENNFKLDSENNQDPNKNLNDFLNKGNI